MIYTSKNVKKTLFINDGEKGVKNIYVSLNKVRIQIMHLFDIQFDFKEKLEPKMRRRKRWAQDEEFNMQL